MFLSEVAEDRDAGCTILQVMYDKSFVRFDFKSGGNNVMITRRLDVYKRQGLESTVRTILRRHTHAAPQSDKTK